MAKSNYLLEHLLNSDFQDRRNPIVIPGDVEGRLSRFYAGQHGDWGTVADVIASEVGRSVTWFPDANVAIRPEAERVWDALRLAALGSQGGSAVISGVVEAELKEWLEDPWRLKERAGMIRSGLEGRTWIRKHSDAARWEPPLKQAVVGYTHLLGVRRSLARATPDGDTLLGTDPADKAQTMNEIMKKIGPRAHGLAKKGRQDGESKGLVNIGDELHCMEAIVYALTHRKTTLILTADIDFLEIFFKAQWFLDTHYRAWLAARAIKEGRYGEVVGHLEDTEGYFEGPVELYRGDAGSMRDVLPRIFDSVRAGVIYVAPDGMVQRLSFTFETPMLYMLETRGLTDGRCTTHYGDANIHIDLGPLKQQAGGHYLGIGKDRFLDFGAHWGKCRLARLDLEHSICCFERSGS